MQLEHAAFPSGLQIIGRNPYKTRQRPADLGYTISRYHHQLEEVVKLILPLRPTGLHTLKNEPININEDASVNYWVAALECSELELRVAVAQVGSAARDVCSELGKAV
jgi:hypothetical protein